MLGYLYEQSDCNGIQINVFVDLFQIMRTILFDIVNEFHGEWLVPTTIQQESEIVHLEEIAWRGFIPCSRQNRKFYNRSHFYIKIETKLDGDYRESYSRKKASCKGMC